MADEIHTRMQRVQAPTSDPLLDCPVAPPRLPQLQTPNHPMLSLRERRKGPIVIARPQNSSLKEGFCGLGGHAPRLARLGA